MYSPNFPESEAFTVLRKIENHTSQKSLAQEIGYSVGKVNYILKALKEKGLIKMDNFLQSPNKKAYKYLLTEEGLKEKITWTKKFIEIKKEEYEELQQELSELKGEKNE